MDCPSCGLENRDDASFCGDCGATLAQEIICPNCRRSNPAGRKFCDGCGRNLTVPSKPTAKGLSFIDDEEIANMLIVGTLG